MTGRNSSSSEDQPEGTQADRPLCPESGGAPAEVTSFIGRSRLLRDAKDLHGTARMITLIGTGGVGKTRLLYRLAHELRTESSASQFEHGVVVVKLSEVRSGDRLASTIAEALGVLDNSTAPMRDRLIERVRHARLLLLLDNCEHLVDAEPAEGPLPSLLRDVLAEAPGVRVIATSRARLGVPGEHLLTVPPLCAGVTETCDSNDDEPHEAVRLLGDRATAAGAPIDLCDPKAAELCRLLDGIPLAIELAAAKLDVLTLTELVEQHHVRHNLLRLLVDGPSEQRHHRTLHGTLDWSYRLLTSTEQLTWSVISVFEGGFDLDAARTICARHEIAPDDVFDLLTRLVRTSLLEVEKLNGRTRYRMLEIIRQYGHELLAKAGTEHTARQAHADYYAALVEQGAQQWLGPDEVVWIRRMRTELANLRAAQEHFVATEQRERGLELAVNATRTRFHYHAGLINEAHRMLALGMDDPASSIGPLQVAALALRAWIALTQGHAEVATPLLARAENGARALGCHDTNGLVLFASGTRLLMAEPDPRRASECLSLFARAEGAFRAAGQHGDAHMTTLFAAFATAFLGDADTALAASARALDSANTAGAQWCISWALWASGLTQLLHGDLTEALRLAHQALRIQHEMDDNWGLAWTSWLLALIAANRGEHRLAGTLFGVANRMQAAAHATVHGLQAFRRVQEQIQFVCRGEIGDNEFETAIAEGEALCTPDALALAHSLTLPRQRTTTAHTRPPGDLSDREYQVAELIAAGKSNQEIATILRISARTVETHVTNIHKRLKLNSRVHVATWVREQHRTTVG
ncbi:AAA family ATPase [Lentzea tibetensis]|uniref:AAA family ATPase n=1 Tax=Lentzea tibetensis TaxID=2591470 RepID=A0A563EHG1_9PSEU|nr:LuxR C-terminal-related transcriptional regulator [Lentzea tibetensis]TWP46067.1 AAA family ATPase [Lentzea tibetensis]